MIIDLKKYFESKTHYYDNEEILGHREMFRLIVEKNG